MPGEVALLAEELALLRSIAEEGGRCAVTFDEALQPLFAVLVGEDLLAVQGEALCLTDMARQFLLLTGSVKDGEPVAISRHRLQAECRVAPESPPQPYRRTSPRTLQR